MTRPELDIGAHCDLADREAMQLADRVAGPHPFLARALEIIDATFDLLQFFGGLSRRKQQDIGSVEPVRIANLDTTKAARP